MTIALIVPEIENNFFAQVINGVEWVARKKNYHVLIYLTHEDYTNEKGILQLLKSGRVDGLMLSVSSTTTDVAHLKDIEASGMPVVLFDRVCGGLEAPKVITDDEEVSYKATEMLLLSGCKRVAFFTIAGHLSISVLRKNGYLRALEKYNIPKQRILADCTLGDAANRKAIRKILSAKDRPDGILSAVEKIAVNTYEVCRELNIRIPEDIKIVSFSNLAACGLFDPPLTTIIQPAFEMGKEGAGLLFKLIDKKKLLPEERNIEIPSVIKLRSSTGFPAVT